MHEQYINLYYTSADFNCIRLGADLPSFWSDPTGTGRDYSLHTHKLRPADPEFLKVRQAFTATGGVGNIICIERIQNPNLYKSYQKEKQRIAKERSTQMQSGKAVLEVQGWHGTNVDSIEQIISNGFNRSYAGTVAGTYFFF